MTWLDKARDLRLLFFLTSGLSGSIILFTFVIPTTVAVAVGCTVVGLVVGLGIAMWAMPEWRGSERDKRVIASVGLAQLLVVSVVSLIVK